MANPTILDFNFGVPRVRVPKEEPAVTDHPAFTIYHVARALHHFENSKGPKTTVPGILRDHPVSSSNPELQPLLFPASLTNYSQDLRVVRAIRPLQRVSQGELTTVKFRDPEKTNQQAAILLYALRPTVEDKKCGPCSSSQGNGPFELCIKSDPKDNNGTCLNCRYTGAMARCDHYKGVPFFRNRLSTS